MAADGKEVQEVDVENLPITDVDMTIDLDKRVIISLEFTAFDKRWEFDIATVSCTAKKLFSKNWSISPDGKLGAFVREFNLWMCELDSGKETQLTHDGEEFFQYGIAASAWGFTMVSKTQACWSSDSQRIFTTQRDTRNVKELPVVQHVPLDGSLRPTVENYKVAYPGDEHIETLRLVSLEVETGLLQAADYSQIPVTRNSWGFFDSKLGWWSTDNRRAYFVDMDRDYKTAKVVEFDTHTGRYHQLGFSAEKEATMLRLHVERTMSDEFGSRRTCMIWKRKGHCQRKILVNRNIRKICERHCCVRII